MQCSKFEIAKGDGDVVTQTFDVRDFNKILTCIPGEVKYTQGENYSCSVTLVRNLFEYLKFYVVNGNFNLRLKDIMIMKYTKFEV